MGVQYGVDVLVLINNSLLAVLCELEPVVIEPLFPDVVVNVLDLKLPFDQQGWSFKLLVDLSGVFVLSIDVARDLGIQDLHHLLLIKHSINVKELLR